MMNMNHHYAPRRNAKWMLNLFVLLFVAVPLAWAQGLTPEHVAKIKNASSAVISPDGNHVAYSVSVPADPYKENKPASSHLYVLDVKSGESRPYYTVGSISNLDFRPKSKSITFLTKRPDDNTRAVYELPLDGGEAVKVFEYKRNISSYDWNPDGHHLVFTSYEDTEKSSSPLEYKANVYEENRSFRRAYVSSTNHMGDMDHEPHELQVQGSVYMHQWNPAGTHIAVSAASTPEVDDYYMNQSVSVVAYETKEVVAEVNNEGKIGQIVWSPDGKQLALRAGADLNDPIDGRILIVSAEGGTPELIDADFEGKYEEIAWTGKNEISFLASIGTSGTIGTIKPNGKDRKYALEVDAHAISSFSKSDKGHIAFTASTPTHPTELFVLKNGKKNPERMTNLNPWLEEIKLGKQEVVEYQPRDNAFTLQGMFIYPVDYKEGDRIPVITVVHGGPEAHYSNGWLTAYSMPGQMAAAKGYGVFYPNYRGSTGRGIEFAYSSHKDLAGAEFDDVVDGVDYLIEEGIADEDRIGVTGGSYGGYASAWMATKYSDRFAASVMFVGISDNISKWGTSDIPEELYHVHARKRLWNDYQWFLERSPIYHVDNSQTPLLIMHGENDTRVHPAQSLELFRHIKVRKPEVPLRLVFYPGEGHGNRNASARLDYNYRMMRWFNTYLMTGDASAEKPSWDVEIPEMK